VLVDSTTGRVRLTGFGIASRLPRELQSLEPPEFIAGTLAYMAPEQAGRVNRSIDSRSDLYSLGVTFYEMLTGSASDPMEWVRCHTARQPAAQRAAHERAGRDLRDHDEAPLEDGRGAVSAKVLDCCLLHLVLLQPASQLFRVANRFLSTRHAMKSNTPQYERFGHSANPAAVQTGSDRGRDSPAHLHVASKAFHPTLYPGDAYVGVIPTCELTSFSVEAGLLPHCHTGTLLSLA
jgi:serine/threonine protein kinase